MAKDLFRDVIKMLRSSIVMVLYCSLTGLFVSGLFLTPAKADGIVSHITSAPVFPNGIVKGIRSGINVFLQTDAEPGNRFLDPQVVGYGIPPNGKMEIEMVSGYRRDPNIPLDEKAILLVAGTPQQGLPAEQLGFDVMEGDNPNTFVIVPNVQDGLLPENLLSPAPGSAFDPIRQRGIKIIHIGRVSAFISDGEAGVVAVRILDSGGNIIAQGSASVDFLKQPAPQVFPTNIPHDQRNHNWQRLGVGKILGVARNTLPLPVILYARNQGLSNVGIDGAGVLSTQQLAAMKYELPSSLSMYTGGLILRDKSGDGLLDPINDEIIGGVTLEAPLGATGQQVLTPLVSERPFLSVSTSRFNERAGASIGGSIMQMVFIAGSLPGEYRIGFSMLNVPGEIMTPTKPKFSYTVLVE